MSELHTNELSNTDHLEESVSNVLGAEEFHNMSAKRRARKDKRHAKHAARVEHRHEKKAARKAKRHPQAAPDQSSGDDQSTAPAADQASSDDTTQAAVAPVASSDDSAAAPDQSSGDDQSVGGDTAAASDQTSGDDSGADQSSGDDQGGDSDSFLGIPEDAQGHILGMSKPLFYTAVGILTLGLGYLVYKKIKK